MPESHVEIGCPGTLGLELPTPNPGTCSKDAPKAYPTGNPAPAQAPVTQSQELSGNKKDNNNDKQ